VRCAHVQDRLALYLAGELSQREKARVIAHLERCAACAALAEELAAAQERVTAAWSADVEPPATLDARVMAAVRALPPQEPFRLNRLNRLNLAALNSWLPWGQWPRSVPMAALACLLVGFGVLLWRARTTASLDLAQLGQAYRRSMQEASAPQLPGSDPQKLGSQLASGVRFPVRVVDLTSEGATLKGGSRTTVDHVPVVAVYYEWQGKQISLYQMDGAQRPPAPLLRMRHDPDSYYVQKAGNLAYVAWHSGKTDCVMVAQSLPMHQLFHLACRACERQEQTTL
jgi:anti-sigma factor RsiW